MFPKAKKIDLVDENHIKKYRGNINNIWLRSSWEIRLFEFLLKSPSVIWLNSEEVIVWYISPKDGKRHIYFIDFVYEYKTIKGKIKKMLIEVKPLYQCIPPKMTYTKTGRKRKKKYDTELQAYLVNIAKWKAAKEFADKNNIDFIIITEKPDSGKWVEKFKIWKYKEVYSWYKEFQKQN